MPATADTLITEHRACDRLLAAVESALTARDWARAAVACTVFADATLSHFQEEEDALFPRLVEAAPMAAGPTSVMRLEHEQVRQLLRDLEAACEAADGAEALGLVESLHLLVQQHNAKEEAVLYPMLDRVLAAAGV
jgi:hemerythrin-like domain-containing protein